MTDEMALDSSIPPPAPLHPLAPSLAANHQQDFANWVTVVHDDAGFSIALVETRSGFEFAEFDGSRLRVVPVILDDNGDAPRCVTVVQPAEVDGLSAAVIDLEDVARRSDGPTEVLAVLSDALDHWMDASSRIAIAPPSDATPPGATSAVAESESREIVVEAEPGSASDGGLTPTTDVVLPDVVSAVQMRADVSDEWSWAASVARIPQIAGLTIESASPFENVRITASVADADVQIGGTLVDRALAAGTTIIGSVHIPLSARLMSQVEERRGAECVIQLDDLDTGKTLARHVEALDLQPRDLWLRRGDPRRAEQRQRMLARVAELAQLEAAALVGDDLSNVEQELRDLHEAIAEHALHDDQLANSLLASFVRPNHPEINTLARESAAGLAASTGDGSFHAFQIGDSGEATEKVEASISSIYETLRTRRISYSEPPPGWDYREQGQRIRDHGDVAQGGLGTCLDTTVLMAAVVEHVGLHPILVLVPGHIFIGYWRHDPARSGSSGVPDWYPGVAVLSDVARIRNLVDGGFLGLIETTALTVSKGLGAADARSEAMRGGFALGCAADDLTIIDVAEARVAGVSPLPAVRERVDGVTEVFEYRPGGATPNVIQVRPAGAEGEPRSRNIDNHPARYRTWKSSLFSLNATNDLLNLKSNARVQPIVLPSAGLGILEDKLNEDVTFRLNSGFDVPEVWRAREQVNALQTLHEGTDLGRQALLGELAARRLYVQRIGRSGGKEVLLSEATYVKELRSMAHAAKTARDERGMNPLFLCLGLLRWEHKADVYAEAPLILVPVNISTVRGRNEFSLSLDASQQTTPNAALLEWLRRDYGIAIPGLAEPLMDRAGIDVDAVISEVRNALIAQPLSDRKTQVVSEARLAMLDLSAFRMWQDLNRHAEQFFERPLVSHLVQSPTETFEDPAVVNAGRSDSDDLLADLEMLETPIPADATQKRAVIWARQGRTFVLQGPPGTGKSQTITNMVAECVQSGLRVLFVAEKGTALAVVQRRLDSIGLGPFTLNLHHEGSNSTEVRAQLRRALAATVTPDQTAMESARRQLRTAHFELSQYPHSLHSTNAAGFSAYLAHDELLVLGDGPDMPVSPTLVAHQADKAVALKSLFQDLQRWTVAAGVREGHPWRLGGPGSGDPFDVEIVADAVRSIIAGWEWAASTTGGLRETLKAITDPQQLVLLAAGGDARLPAGPELAEVMAADWPRRAPATFAGCESRIATEALRLHGFSPDIIAMDLRRLSADLAAAAASGFLGRSRRQDAVLAALIGRAPVNSIITSDNAGQLLADLIAVQEAAAWVRSTVAAVPGLSDVVPPNPFAPGAMKEAKARLDELVDATAPLRASDGIAERVRSLAETGSLAGHQGPLAAYADAWARLWEQLAIRPADFEAWRGGLTLDGALARHVDEWRRHVEHERLLPLQQWCTLVRNLEPMRDVGLDEQRVELLEGRTPAYAAEEALARGVASASLRERIAAAGLDRFDALAHDQRVTAYTSAQHKVRQQWITDGPQRLLERRGAGGLGARTGGLARELEKTRAKLGTRPILRKYGEAVQELTPLILCSPSSVVDLIEPGVMEFDVVVFDEASQITVPEAIGALGRARAAIIVGDSKQMPPTRRVGGSQLDDAIDDDPDAEEIVEDQESILSECELARVPTLSLSWHYRSQDEALIAFSNRAYYRGALSSFPTPTLLSSETGVEFRRVAQGQYLRAGSPRVEVAPGIVGGSNTNPAEAREIVEYVHRLVNASPSLPSVGIVTFNEQQRQLIEEMLNASADPKVVDVMSDVTMGRGDVLFVKALEQVQGDERDVIIFSVAFSKQANGKIPTNFGPLTNSGGERRLNVAITRARRKNIVFCSFDPVELDVAGSSFNGPKDFKEFLVFAKASGRNDEVERKQEVAIRDRHRDDIAETLRAAGLHVMSDVGMSNFRLDLVIARADAPNRPILPVLLDGESWRQRITVSDRDVLPVEVLEGLMGWPRVARIWWPMWLQNREEVLNRVLAEVDRAEELLDEKAAATTIVAPPDVAPPATTATPPTLVETLVALADEAQPSAMVASITPVSPPEPTLPATGGDHAAARGDVGTITEFVPAHTNHVGSRDVLDSLPDKVAVAAVRQQLFDVIEAEGPVELGRLVRIVARRFGLSAVRAARADDIARALPRGSLRKGRLGSFAWPADVDPESWAAFRVADGIASRTLEEIAPQEIGNAMRAVLTEYPDLGDEDVLRRTAELFGISRLGANVRGRLEAVRARLDAGI